MAHDRLGGAVAQSEQHANGVAQQVHEPEFGKIAVVTGVPSGGAAVAALVGRDRVIAGRSQRRQHLAPAVGKFGKAVQQQNGGPSWRFMAGLEQVHVEAIDAGQDARAHAGGKG